MTDSASSTGRRRNTRSSASAVGRRSPREDGSSNHTSTSPSRQASVIAAKVARQPQLPPITVPIGAPKTIARFIPNASQATMVADRSGGAELTATTMACAKNVEVTSAASTRAANNTAKLGATAEIAFPSTATASRLTISRFRSTPAVTAVSTGPPMIMPTA
nr:hypothetical protein [Nakamurella aerolata]